MKKISSSYRADFALSKKPRDRNVAQLLLYGGRIMVRDAEQALPSTATTEQKRAQGA